jgi:hypothetical protein
MISTVPGTAGWQKKTASRSLAENLEEIVVYSINPIDQLRYRLSLVAYAAGSWLQQLANDLTEGIEHEPLL